MLLTYFFLGAFALISQTILLREFFVVVYGNEFIFGVLLANWLLGIFCGAITGGVRGEKSKNHLLLFLSSVLVMCVLLPASITLTRFLYMITGTPAGVYIGFFKFFLFSALLVVPISFFIGFVFPLAAKVQLRDTGAPHENSPSSDNHSYQVKGIADIYIFEAFGSLFSGILYTFFLVGRFNVYLITALAILPLLFFTIVFLFKFRYFKMFFTAVLLMAVNLILLVPGVNNKLESYTVNKRWNTISTLPLTYSIESPYQNIAVAELFNQYNLYLNTMLAAVFPNEDDNMLLAAHLVCQHPHPRRILVIGDAVSGLAKSLLDFNVKEVISVEIDARVVDTIKKFLPPQEKAVLKDPRFKIIIGDGRKYVKDLLQVKSLESSLFDIVYLNVSEPSTLLLNRYYTRDFFSDLRQVMKDNGVIALKATSSENYKGGLITDYTASIFHTVRSVFPEVAVAPGPQNFIFASCAKGSVSDDARVLAQRYSDSGLKPEKLGMIFYSLYPQEKTGYIKRALSNSPGISVNTDDTPIASLYFNKIIGWYSESNLTAFLGFFEKVGLWHVLIILLMLVMLRTLYLWVMKKRKFQNSPRFFKFHILLAVFSSGLTGLALELVIIYTFQIYFGDIYHIIGFIIAVFMFGLPLGAMLSKSWLNREKSVAKSRVIIFIIGIQVILAVITVLVPFIARLFAGKVLLHQLIIFAETILVGFAVGLVFPLAVHLYLGNREKTGRTAGIIDASDHFGAAIGAFFVGTLFLPVMGVEKVCLLVAFFPIISAILLVSDFIRQKNCH